MVNGRTLRVLSIVDTFTRECLGLEVDTSLPSRRVTRARDQEIAARGKLERIRIDNGSELTSCHFVSWGIEQRIELVISSLASRSRTHMWKALMADSETSV
jgi:putative transposase